MTSPSFPSALDALANPGPTTETDDAGFELDIVVSRLQNCIMAIENKLGIGVGGPPAGAAAVLRRTAAGTSAWGQIQGGDIGAQTITGGLAGAASHIGFLTVTGRQAGSNSNILDGTIATANMMANAISQVWTASGTASAPATTNASFVTVPDMTVSITTQGGPVIAMLTGSFHGSVVGTTLDFQLTLTPGSAFGALLRKHIVTVNYVFPVAFFAVITPAAGTYTLDARWAISAGGGAVADGTWRQLCVVELRR